MKEIAPAVMCCGGECGFRRWMKAIGPSTAEEMLTTENENDEMSDVLKCD